MQKLEYLINLSNGEVVREINIFTTNFRKARIKARARAGPGFKILFSFVSYDHGELRSRAKFSLEEERALWQDSFGQNSKPAVD